MREHIKPAQREDQKHLRRPDADTFDLDESLDNLLVGHARQPVEPQTAAPDAFCQIQQVRRFLRRNANRSQLPWRQSAQTFRGNPFGRNIFFEPRSNRCGSLSRDLLRQNR